MALKNPYISTSVFPLIKPTFDVNMNLSNSIITTNDVENGNNNIDDEDEKKNIYPISSDINSSLPTSLDLLSNVNHQIIPVNKQKIEYNGSFVSHIPNMSSSSSSSQSSIPAINDQSIPNKSQLNDPKTRPILVGQETLIEIDRGQSGLGLSVVGGSDTQLVWRRKKI